MTKREAFTDDEWATILQGPTGAGMLVITSSKGGTFRETFAESKAYAEARAQHGQSELLDAILSSRPKMDRTRYHSPDELKAGALAHLSGAVALLEAKATPEELEGYRSFVLALCAKVADAHSEGGESAQSPGETAAIKDIAAALGTTA